MDFCTLPVTKSDIQFLKSAQSEDKLLQAVQILAPHLKLQLSEKEKLQVRKIVTNFESQFRVRWQKAVYSEVKFQKQNSAWLSTNIRVPKSLCESTPLSETPPNSDPNVVSPAPQAPNSSTGPHIPSTSTAPQIPCTITTAKATSAQSACNVLQSETTVRSRRATLLRSAVHRSELPYNLKGIRAKQKYIVKLSQSQDQPTTPLLKATSRTLKKRGLSDTAVLIDESTVSPGRPLKMRRRLEFGMLAEEQKTFTPEEALSLLLEMSLTVDNYQLLRTSCVKKGHKNLFPSYKEVVKAKTACRPDPNTVRITESHAEVQLRSLLEHTTRRIVEMQKEVVIQEMRAKNVQQETATLIVSWGLDGSTGQSRYKQLRFDGLPMNDSSLVATTLVPLQLKNNQNPNLPYWHNRRAQSSNFCRPIKLQFAKEDRQLIMRENASMQHQIRQLQPVKIDLGNDLKLDVDFNLHMTLIDGKVLNHITNTNSMQRCPLCGARPSEFNDISRINSDAFPVPQHNLVYGVSPLHAWIRFFECCLKISYKLDIEKWVAHTDEEKMVVAAKRQQIQTSMLEELGLLVDQPRPGGAGSTNDGNTARRAFLEFQRFSDVLGLDQTLVKNFRTILLALNSQLPIKPEEFGKICTETAVLYVEKYEWYPMPATVHKILMHGKKIVENSSLPVGMFGEDAGESCNKRYKFVRLHHSRKNSRLNTITDLFNRCTDLSDPLLSSQRMPSQKQIQKLQALPPEVQVLLEPAMQDANHASMEVDEDLPVGTEEPLDEFEVAELDLMLDVEEEVVVTTEADMDVNELMKITVPEDLELKFLEYAHPNTIQNIETCGILAGSLVDRECNITHLILPNQTGTANSCAAVNEEEIYGVMEQESILQFGWIHTHPTQTSFLSSVDLHTHFGYQSMLPESVAIVCAPSKSESDVFTMTPTGMSVVRNCQLTGFHSHEEVQEPLFCQAAHSMTVATRNIIVKDIRSP